MTGMELVTRRIEQVMRQQEWRNAMAEQRIQFGKLLERLPWRNAKWQTAPISFHQKQGFARMLEGAMRSFYGDQEDYGDGLAQISA